MHYCTHSSSYYPPPSHLNLCTLYLNKVHRSLLWTAPPGLQLPDTHKTNKLACLHFNLFMIQKLKYSILHTSFRFIMVTLTNISSDNKYKYMFIYIYKSICIWNSCWNIKPSCRKKEGKELCCNIIFIKIENIEATYFNFLL